MSDRISVIIRTKGDAERAALLPRAVNSVLTQQDVSVELIVVLNGTQYDADLLAWLRNDERIRCAVLDGPSLAKASETGRALLTSDYFTFLDDDDEFLPGSLAMRVRYLNENPQIDCVVTNAEYTSQGRIRPIIDDVEKCSRDLVGALLAGQNWMASCAGTFRASTVTDEYFERFPTGCEWTLLAFRVASTLNVSLLSDVTCRLYATRGSESAGGEKYMRGAVDAMLEIARWNRDPKRVPSINRAIAKKCHDLSSFYRLNGDFRQAWALHWSSVANGYGLKYLPYSLVLATRSRKKVSKILSLSKPA